MLENICEFGLPKSNDIGGFYVHTKDRLQTVYVYKYFSRISEIIE